MYLLIIISLGNYVNTFTPMEFFSKDECIKAQAKVMKVVEHSSIKVEALCLYEGGND